MGDRGVALKDASGEIKLRALLNIFTRYLFFYPFVIKLVVNVGFVLVRKYELKAPGPMRSVAVTIAITCFMVASYAVPLTFLRWALALRNPAIQICSTFVLAIAVRVLYRAKHNRAPSRAGRDRAFSIDELANSNELGK